jgi:Glycosyl transferase family group 2
MKVVRFVLVCAITAGLLWVAIKWPPVKYLIYVAWMIPVAELFFLAAGYLWFRWFWREDASKFSQLIIQITTAGLEQERISEIIQQIRDYQLPMTHEVWVVTEPPDSYPYKADTVLVVPENFPCKAEKKGRALEFSRLVRQGLGLSRPDVKIIFNDDDVSLTRGYILRAFAGDYDICEGVVSPRTEYAVRPFGHFAVSHADDIRTHACLVYCSVFQGILKRPLHVHGEGMTMTGEAESKITWNVPLVASEDLSFGQRAAGKLRWGWFHEYAEVTSPWDFRDFIIQRSRWLWGDIHAITHRSVMPFPAAGRVTFKYAAGAAGLICSVAGLYLRATGRIPATAGILDYAKLSILAWVGVFFACGWIAASTPGRSDDSRMLAGVLAVLMMPVSVALAFAGIIIPLIQGNPRTFRVIAKTRKERKRFRMTWRKALTAAGCLLVLVAGCTAAAHLKQLQPPAVPESPPIAIPSTPPPATPQGTFQRGVDIDAYTYPGQDMIAAAQTDVAYVKLLHANSIMISFPFFMAGPNANSVYTTGATPAPAALASFIRVARQAGLRVSLRPLLDESNLGVSRVHWVPANAAAWFRSYRHMLIPYAAMAQREHVKTFIVGTEFSWFDKSPHWQSLDAAIARRFHGQLACADNWGAPVKTGLHGGCGTATQTVDAYKPIIGSLSAGWKAFDQSLPNGTVITEVGIDAVSGAYIRPYQHTWTAAATLDPQVQASWFRAACHAAISTGLGGIYFWSIGLGPPQPPTIRSQGAWSHSAGGQAIQQCFRHIQRSGK